MLKDYTYQDRHIAYKPKVYHMFVFKLHISFTKLKHKVGKVLRVHADYENLVLSRFRPT
jgi:hypothetical protein